MGPRSFVAPLALVMMACEPGAPGVPPPGGDTNDPAWHFERIEHPHDFVLNDLWGQTTDNEGINEGETIFYAVGQFGTIITNRGPDGGASDTWRKMDSPTTAHLTAIVGLGNASQFGMRAWDGEMFAVGWQGTVLHYHPNPDDDPVTEDGRWSLIAGPEGQQMVVYDKPDSACPDYDGDGVADDGDNSGWSGDNPCAHNVSSGCDDNCRTSSNGTLRPIAETVFDGCLGPGDVPDSGLSQVNFDGDQNGAVCDDDDTVATTPPGFSGALFSIHATAAGTDVQVVAVGEGGAMVQYSGPSASVDLSALPGTPAITDIAAWRVQSSVAYRYDVDCPPGSPQGQACPGSGRLPPSCPAQCNPIRTDCDCPPDQGQCCDPVATTGAPPVVTGCDGGSGICSALCPACFRRLDQTLRAVGGDDNYLVAVGARGTVLLGDPADPAGVWEARTCVPTPLPLADQAKLVSVDARDNVFWVTGSAATLMRVDPAGGCVYSARADVPAGFLHDVLALGADQGFAVGDGGVLLRFSAGNIDSLEVDILEGESLHAIRSVWHPVLERTYYWMVGAKGTLIKGAFW